MGPSGGLFRSAPAEQGTLSNPRPRQLAAAPAASAMLAQHPFRDPPTISVRFAEPPSVVGTAGAQIVEDWLDAAAVAVAACVEVPGISPGNNNGTCELVEADALMPAVLPPAVVVDPLPEPADAAPPEDPVGKEDVGTLSGSDPRLPPLVPPPPLVVLPLAVVAPSAPIWPLFSSIVWA